MADLSIIPYYIRAVFDWVLDSNLTPFISVYTKSDLAMIVPAEYANDDGILTLNISPTATIGLNISNELISFRARFKGRAMDISFPIESVVAIYAKETNQGMHFVLDADQLTQEQKKSSKPKKPKPKPNPKPGNEVSLVAVENIQEQTESNVIDMFSYKRKKEE